MQRLAGAVSPRVFGFAGWSGAGKTTLIVKLLGELSARGLRVSLVKHAHHDFDIDTPGKDSHRHRLAGAQEVLVSSRNRFALIRELRGQPELTLGQAIGRLSACDLVLIEGYKRARLPKLEVWRAAVGKPMLQAADANIVAVATDDPWPHAGQEWRPLTCFSLSDTLGIADFVVREAIPVAELTEPLMPLDDHGGVSSGRNSD